MKNKKFWIAAVSLTLFNTIMSNVSGNLETKHCAQTGIGSAVSVVLSLATIITLGWLVATSIRSRRWLSAIIASVAIVLAVAIGFWLYLIAYGGLDWCNYRF